MDELECDICKRRFKLASFLNSHKKTHAARVKKLVCPLWPLCAIVKNENGLYSKATNLKVHFGKHHKQYELNMAGVETVHVESIYSILHYNSKTS